MSDESGALTTVFVDDKATKRRLKKSKLVVLEGPDKGKELVIERERVTIGRSVICDLELADKAVSGTHIEIIASEKGVLLRDLDSTNGTYVGDLRVREVWVRPGTVVRVGQSKIQFEPVKGTVEIDLSNEEQFHDLVGRSVRMREIFATLEKVAGDGADGARPRRDGDRQGAGRGRDPQRLAAFELAFRRAGLLRRSRRI